MQSFLGLLGADQELTLRTILLQGTLTIVMGVRVATASRRADFFAFVVRVGFYYFYRRLQLLRGHDSRVPLLRAFAIRLLGRSLHLLCILRCCQY